MTGISSSTTPTTRSLRKDRLFRTGFAATVVALLACLSTHLLTLLGVAGAVAWLGGLEHALVLVTLGAAALTALAVWRHRRGDCAVHGRE
ncbi:hypothetical protein QWY84_17790 [Aquisalimonas lutea]|uniref:hypothetical protein n=1 Tax=Aquisalimonas lutea TaxID=1327750 RepID=UPI0025B43786|nr:hypothetical protein [Aquisalimonas lutea]MDN3519462.1 hypothetical protein [Aquisalimonas lutea]